MLIHKCLAAGLAGTIGAFNPITVSAAMNIEMGCSIVVLMGGVGACYGWRAANKHFREEHARHKIHRKLDDAQMEWEKRHLCK